MSFFCIIHCKFCLKNVIRAVFLDISKAFDKVWDEGIIHKLKRNGISEDLLSLLTDLKK